jgi:dihydroorotase
MPNIRSPVRTPRQAVEYPAAIIREVPTDWNLEPLITLQIDADTSIRVIVAAAKNPIIHSGKLYPYASEPIRSRRSSRRKPLFKVLEAMEYAQLPPAIHAEVTDNHVADLDREAFFVTEVLPEIRERFPALKVTIEHISSREAVELVLSAREHLAATVTPQHLLFTRSDFLAHPARGHLYCKPILKARRDQEALLNAVGSGHSSFFVGTDSAPFRRTEKESASIPSGCFGGAYAVELYAHAFERIGALHNLEAFLSHNGPDFFGLERNTDMLLLEKREWRPEKVLSFGDSVAIALTAAETFRWRVRRVAPDEHEHV